MCVCVCVCLKVFASKHQNIKTSKRNTMNVVCQNTSKSTNTLPCEDKENEHRRRVREHPCGEHLCAIIYCIYRDGNVDTTCTV